MSVLARWKSLRAKRAQPFDWAEHCPELQFTEAHVRRLEWWPHDELDASIWPQVQPNFTVRPDDDDPEPA